MRRRIYTEENALFGIANGKFVHSPDGAVLFHIVRGSSTDDADKVCSVSGAILGTLTRRGEDEVFVPMERAVQHVSRVPMTVGVRTPVIEDAHRVRRVRPVT